MWHIFHCCRSRRQRSSRGGKCAVSHFGTMLHIPLFDFGTVVTAPAIQPCLWKRREGCLFLDQSCLRMVVMMVMMPWNCWQISWNGSVIFKEDVEDWKEREGDHDNNARTKILCGHTLNISVTTTGTLK